MDAFPAFFPLSGRTVVVAGSGEPAQAKLRLLAGSPARIVHLQGADAADPAAYAGAALAFVASADEDFAQAAAAAARAAHVPVNVVDRPQLCDFTTPAVIDRGEVVAAIGTGGASPMLATMLRADIEQRVPEGAGRVAALFRQMQDEVRAALPQLHERRAFLREALAGPAASAAMAGDMQGAARLLREALAGVENPIDQLAVYVRLQIEDLSRRHMPPGPAMRSVLSPEAFAKLGNHVRELQMVLAGILSAAIERGYLPENDIRELAQLVHGSLSSSADRTDEASDRAARERHIENTIRFIQLGLGARFDESGRPVRLDGTPEVHLVAAS